MYLNTYIFTIALFPQIISFLDLQVQDLEGEKCETNNRCNHLQASLDLQLGSHSLKVQW